MTLIHRTDARSPWLADTPRPKLEDTARALEDYVERRRIYDALTQRRDHVEPSINAFELRDETCPASISGPLNGLPVTVKDQIAVAGWPRSFGLERLSKRPDTTSASLVARLLDIGAVVTGKTALPPNAMDFQTGNARRGPTRNPHNPQFTSGGSTGGGAAAVASGMSPLDIGADLSGSPRIPAARCRGCSYVPTEGLWPNDGLLRGTQRLDHFARIGLTAPSAQDLNFVWKALDADSEMPATSTSDARIAVWSPAAKPPCDDETFKAWQSLAQALPHRDFDIIRDDMHDLLDPSVHQLGGEIIGHMTGALVPAFIRWMMRRDRRAAAISPNFVSHVHTGYRRDPQRYQENLDRLAAFRKRAERRCSGYEALLLPVTPVCAFRHIAPLRDQSGVRTYEAVFETQAGPVGYFDALTHFTLPLTVLGWPVVTFPVSRDANGLPIGAQLIGKPGGDRRLLALATQVQSALRW